MDKLDPGLNGVKQVFPILVVTDRAFSALGVNRAVLEEFDRIRDAKYKFEKFIMVFNPVIAHYDTLFLLATRLYLGRITLQVVLVDYILNNWRNMTPFDSYVYDHYRESDEERKAGLAFLLTDVVNNITIRTENTFLM